MGSMSTFYEIVVEGELGATIACAFEGMTLEPRGNNTAIVGPVTDQAQLSALLGRIADLGLRLVRVEELPRPPSVPSA